LSGCGGLVMFVMVFVIMVFVTMIIGKQAGAGKTGHRG